MKGLVGALALLSLSQSAHADPLLFNNGRLFLDVRINGISTEALLDSAAEVTLIDPEFAAKANLNEGSPQTIRGSGGTAKAHIVEGATIEALGKEMKPDAVVVTDLKELSKRLIKRSTSVVLGRELFDAARLRIDIMHGTIDAVGRETRPSGTPLPLTKHAGVESIPVSADGKLVHAEFDLGNGSGPLISRVLANQLHLKTVAKEPGGGIGGPLTRDVVILQRLEVAGVTFRNVRAAVDDLPNANDLNIGTSILKRFLITTDFEKRMLWLQPLRRT